MPEDEWGITILLVELRERPAPPVPVSHFEGLEVVLQMTWVFGSANSAGFWWIVQNLGATYWCYVVAEPVEIGNGYIGGENGNGCGNGQTRGRSGGLSVPWIGS